MISQSQLKKLRGHVPQCSAVSSAYYIISPLLFDILFQFDL